MLCVDLWDMCMLRINNIHVFDERITPYIDIFLHIVYDPIFSRVSHLESYPDFFSKNIVLLKWSTQYHNLISVLVLYTFQNFPFVWSRRTIQYRSLVIILMVELRCSIMVYGVVYARGIETSPNLRQMLSVDLWDMCKLRRNTKITYMYLMNV